MLDAIDTQDDFCNEQCIVKTKKSKLTFTPTNMFMFMCKTFDVGGKPFSPGKAQNHQY